MKKFMGAIIAAAILFPVAASAQQYVSQVYMPNGNNGYGTAIYADAGQPSYQPQSSYAPAPATYTAPAASPEAADSYATYAANPRMERRAYNWTGLYIGGYGGGAFGGNDKANEATSQGGTSPAGTNYNSSGAPYSYDSDTGYMAGGTLGYNYELPLRGGALTGLVIGVEGEGGSFEMNGNGTDPNSGGVNGDTHDKTRIGGWDAIAAGRAGVAFDRMLVYGKVGAVFSNATSRITDGCTTGACGGGTLNATGTQSIVDAAFGGGVEYALSTNWSLKGEYMYLDTSDSYQVCGAGGGTAAGSNFCSQHQLDGTHTVKLGLNYHFNDFLSDRGGSSPRW